MSKQILPDEFWNKKSLLTDELVSLKLIRSEYNRDEYKGYNQKQINERIEHLEKNLAELKD